MLNHTHDADYGALWGQVNLCLECNNIQHPKYFSYGFGMYKETCIQQQRLLSIFKLSCQLIVFLYQPVYLLKKCLLYVCSSSKCVSQHTESAAVSSPDYLYKQMDGSELHYH